MARATVETLVNKGILIGCANIWPRSLAMDALRMRDRGVAQPLADGGAAFVLENKTLCFLESND